MTRTSRHLGKIAVGLFVLSVCVSQGHAATGQCEADTTFWSHAAMGVGCSFGAGGNATANSSSGVNPDTRAFWLVADLIKVSGIPSGHRVGARALGLDQNGMEIASCRTTGGEVGTDFDAAKGTTVAVGTGCNDARKHRLIITLAPTPPH
jgi:hypothetical protein